MITSTDYTGRACTLTRNGEPVKAGTTLKDFRGNPYRIDGGRAPQHAASTGKIWTTGGEFFPSVFSCKWTPSK